MILDILKKKKKKTLPTIPLSPSSDRDCQVKHWSLSHKSECKNDLIRHYKRELAKAYELSQTGDFEQNRQEIAHDLDFWGDLERLHCRRWGVSNLVEFVRSGSRAEEEIHDAFLIYKHFAWVASNHNEEGLALRLYEEQYEVMDEAGVHWTKKYSITVNYADKIASSENDRKFDEAIGILRKYIRDTTEGLTRERRGRGRYAVGSLSSSVYFYIFEGRNMTSATRPVLIWTS